MLAGVWILYFCFGLTSVGMAPLVRLITTDLQISHTAMGGVLGVWQLTYIIAAVPCGTLLDRVGPRKALLIGALVISITGWLRSFASGYVSLCLAVAVFGLGGPIISAGAPKVVTLWFHGRDRGTAMGLYITGPAVGAMTALSLTHPILLPLFDHDWRRVLQLWASVALVGALVWALIASRPLSRRMEPARAKGPRHPQRQVLVGLLRVPGVPLLLAMAVGMFMFNHGLSNWLPELLRTHGMSASTAGYWATIPTLVGIGGALMIPRLAIPQRRFLVLGALCMSAALASVMLLASAGPVLLVGLMLQGVARSSMMTVAMLTLVEMPGVGEKHAGTAGGLFFSAAEIGGAGGPMVLGLLYDATGGFEAGLSMLAGIATLLVISVTRLARIASATVPRPAAAGQQAD